METRLKLIFGVFIVSWSAIIIRWIGPVEPMVIAFYRLSFSALILLPLNFRSFATQKQAAQKSGWLLGAAGLFLALHFFTWITSLQITTVGNSIFLESTHPIFGLLLSVIFLKEKASLSLIPAFVFGILGMYLMVYGDLHGNYEALTGDLLAVSSALFIAAYLLIARMMSKTMPLLPYLFYVYSSAAFFLFVAILITGQNFWVLPLNAWLLLLLLAIGPNLTGHSLLNWASRKMPIFKVNMALLAESVLATVYAAILLSELPPKQFYSGALLILFAISLVFKGQKKANKG